MKTYLTRYIDSSGAPPSAVYEALRPLGFRPSRGPHDFVRTWEDSKEVEDLVWFADKVHEALAVHRVLFKLETVG